MTQNIFFQNPGFEGGGILNSSHFDKLEHTYKFTKEILKAKNNLVYSTHFDLSERIRTFFQKF